MWLCGVYNITAKVRGNTAKFSQCISEPHPWYKTGYQRKYFILQVVYSYRRTSPESTGFITVRRFYLLGYPMNTISFMAHKSRSGLMSMPIYAPA